MARELISGNDVLSFNASSGTIVAKGYIPLPKLLLINNATKNTILYNFSDPNVTATCSTNTPGTNQTTIVITPTPVGFSDSDELQIFYEKEEIEFKPSRTYRDPVSKFRVSEPQTLIDTDFEYSIQPTKWETLKLVNNIPTSYASQNPSDAINVKSISVAGNKVDIITNGNHGLVTGSVVEITGLTNSQYEGIFPIEVSSDDSFTYKVTFSTTETNIDLKTIYTLVYPGAFYTGSSVKVGDVAIPGIGSTIITVSTEYEHGFNKNSKIYLKNSRATIQNQFQSPQDVVAAGIETFRAEISGMSTSLPEYYNNSSIIFDDFIGSWEVALDSSNFQLIGGQDYITYNLNTQTGFAGIHTIGVGNVVFLYSPIGNLTFSNDWSRTFKPYRVITSTYNSTTGISSIQVTSSPTGNTADNIVNEWGSMPTTYGKHRMVVGYRITSSGPSFTNSGAFDITGPSYQVGLGTGWTGGSTGVSTFGFSPGEKVIVVSNSRSLTGIPQNYKGYISSRNNGSRKEVVGIDSARLYNVLYQYNSGNYLTSLKTTDYTLIAVFLTDGKGSVTYTYNSTELFGVFKVKPHPLANTVYLPPKVGYSTSKFKDGQLVKYTGTQNTTPIVSVASSIGGLSYNERYLLKEVSGYPNWYNLYSKTDTSLTKLVGLYTTDTSVGNVYKTTSPGIQTHIFQSVKERQDRYTIKISDPKRANLSTGKNIEYSSSTTLIGGLSQGITYKVNTADSTISDDQFRITNLTSSKSAPVKQLAYAANASVGYIVIGTANTGLTLGDVGIEWGTTGKYIQLSGVNGTQQENEFWNRTHKITGIGATSATVAKINPGTGSNVITIEVPTNDEFRNIANSYTINAASAVTKLPNAYVCGITTFTSVGGIGTHFIFQTTDGIVDGIYDIKDTTNTSFTISVGSASSIGQITKSFGPTDVSEANDTIKITNHNFADGTAVSYGATTVVPGLINGNTYYVRVLDKDYISLCSEITDALDRITGTVIDLTGNGGAGHVHTLTSNSIKGFLTGKGTVAISTVSNIITGTNTKFLSDFTIGDTFRAYTTAPTSAGNYFESKITSIKSDKVLKVEQNQTEQLNVGIITSVGIATTNANYFIPTSVFPLSDGKVTHRPFDGGVNLTSGLVPNTKIIRQTRRYFRYQSGKGIQVSVAANFNPTFDIDVISAVGVGTTSYYNFRSKYPHNLSQNAINSNQTIKISGLTGTGSTIFTGINTSGQVNNFNIISIPSDFDFQLDLKQPIPDFDNLKGFPQYNLLNWGDCAVRLGLFDDQNGLFFEYDGNQLYVVRRYSTQQLSGYVSVTRGSQRIEGTNTRFASQLSAGDSVVIRGQTYKVVNTTIENGYIDVQPAYRGNSTTNIIISKVQEDKIPQSQWNLDKMDGTGESGYNLDINKIQMVYMDYSWYGAGSVRFGFKDTLGEVRYCHEFYHNNVFTESYMRSGNVPARYEVETYNNPLFSPSLFHWGVSVIMDGKFDDDKAYLFTADSNTLPFTNGGQSADITGTVSADLLSISAIDATEGSRTTVGMEFAGTAVPSRIATGTKVKSIEINPTSPKFGGANPYIINLDRPALLSGAATFNLFSGTANQLRDFIPLVSIRLAPSVDNGLTGNLGFRDIITRMQLTLKSAGVLVTHDCEVRLILNGQLSNESFTSVGSPSLAQIYKHEVGESLSGGTIVYSFRAQGGSTISSTTPPKRAFNVTTVELSELALLGNSILGGDGVYPDGPDILTVAVKPVDTSGITGGSPFIAGARISWAEAQA